MFSLYLHFLSLIYNTEVTFFFLEVVNLVFVLPIYSLVYISYDLFVQCDLFFCMIFVT